jgi:hypothetical protein
MGKELRGWERNYINMKLIATTACLSWCRRHRYVLQISPCCANKPAAHAAHIKKLCGLSLLRKMDCRAEAGFRGFHHAFGDGGVGVDGVGEV